MKQYKLVLLTTVLFLVSIGVFLACNKKDMDTYAEPGQEMVPTAASIAGNFGLINSQGAFQPITDAQLSDYYHEIFELDDNVTLLPPAIIEQIDTSTGERVYTVKSWTTDSTTRITSLVDRQGQRYILSSKSCKCNSTYCTSNYGCDAKIYFGVCHCTSCTGDCNKSSCETTLQYRQLFFES